MKHGKKVVEGLFEEVLGLQPRIKLGYGSFLTIDFGKEVTEEILTREGKETLSFGEWHLWIYMCAWRIDLSNEPFIGSDDDRQFIQEKLVNLNDKKLLLFSVINSAFDSVLKFESDYELKLFSFNVRENEQWKFFTPEQKVFIAGPGNSWCYRSSNEVT